MDREVMHLRDSLIPKYAELVYYGFWFAPEREALQALVDEGQQRVSGTVRLKLYKGNVITCGRKSQYSLYDFKVASMEGVKSWYNQSDATGFIRLNGLRLRARKLAQGGPEDLGGPPAGSVSAMADPFPVRLDASASASTRGPPVLDGRQPVGRPRATSSACRARAAAESPPSCA